MHLNLENRIALVAGSSRGIGYAIVEVLLAEGARVVITGRSEESLKRAAARLRERYGGDRFLCFPGDLTEPVTIRSLIRRVRDHWGRIEIFVGAVGSGRGTLGLEVPELEWQRLFEINFWSAQRLLNELLPDFIQSGSGCIVLIASITGVESTSAPLPYSTAKAALIHYVKNLARQLGPYNVRANCVAPGNILFPGGSWETHLAQRHEEVMNYIRCEVPLNRFGDPREIADVVAFLASDRASFITGACVVADGGQTRGI